jgi:hypothetical protein
MLSNIRQNKQELRENVKVIDRRGSEDDYHDNKNFSDFIKYVAKNPILYGSASIGRLQYCSNDECWN